MTNNPKQLYALLFVLTVLAAPVLITPVLATPVMSSASALDTPDIQATARYIRPSDSIASSLRGQNFYKSQRPAIRQYLRINIRRHSMGEILTPYMTALSGMLADIRTRPFPLARKSGIEIVRTLPHIQIIPGREPSAVTRAPDTQTRPDAKAIEASTQTRFAFIGTDNPQTDRISRLGLEWLSRQLTRRTSLEPGPPHKIILESPAASANNLSLYPVIYWPITPGTRLPSRQQLAAFEAFMDNGGLLVIDTADGEARSLGIETPQSAILQSILLKMNIPPLAPVPAQHALRRSFYLLDSFPGRNTGGTVWVEAQPTSASAPARVTSLIISGRDWAAAWAHDRNGTPIRSMPLGSSRQRELSIRTGINIVMIALTGNYKIDQLHVDQLLENLEGKD